MPETNTEPLYGPRAHRIAAGLSVEQVAKKARYCVRYVGDLERLWERIARGEKGMLPAWTTAEHFGAALRSERFPEGLCGDVFYKFSPESHEIFRMIRANGRPNRKPAKKGRKVLQRRSAR